MPTTSFDQLHAQAMSLIVRGLSAFSQLHWIYLVSSLILAGLWYLRDRRRGRRVAGKFIAYVFPKEIYLHPSAIVDYKLLVTNRLIRPAVYGFVWLTNIWVFTRVQGWLGSVFGEPDRLFIHPQIQLIRS